jgi:hypothetical protein
MVDRSGDMMGAAISVLLLSPSGVGLSEAAASSIDLVSEKQDLVRIRVQAARGRFRFCEVGG